MDANRAIVVAMVIAMLFSGCTTMRTPYIRPEIHAPAQYQHADSAAPSSPSHWWRIFGDPQLDALIDAALARNNDLALAALNVRSAQLQAHLAVINPTLSVGYTDDYMRELAGPASATQFHSLTASASYEVDLWNQLGATLDVARWEARATEQDRESAVVTLIGTAVNLYYQLANLNYRITLGRQSVGYGRQALDLVQAQASAGAATQLEIAESEQSLEVQEADQSALLEQRIETRSAMTMLLNGAPWPETQERSAVPDDPPPPIAPGLPASLLDRRPDLRAAEIRLREALAQTDATRLSF